jgi:hypothetical protein
MSRVRLPGREPARRAEAPDLEARLNPDGSAALRQALQDHFDLWAATEERHDPPVGSDGRPRPYVDRKRMAEVGAVYVVEQVPRTPADVMARCEARSPPRPQGQGQVAHRQRGERRRQRHRRSIEIPLGPGVDRRHRHPPQATALGLDAATRQNAGTCADYLLAKAPYLDYPIALAEGWPIATGVIEGAVRHVVRDRMASPAPAGASRVPRQCSIYGHCAATVPGRSTGGSTLPTSEGGFTSPATLTVRSPGLRDLPSQGAAPK